MAENRDAKAPVAQIQLEKSQDSTDSSDGMEEEPQKLHAKTYLTVFTMCLVYFAQVLNVVGAGAVSQIVYMPSGIF